MAITMARNTVLASPGRFLEYSSALLPWMGALALSLLGAGFYLSLFAPPDGHLGQTVKLMFIHVPAAWMGVVAYLVMVGASLVSIVFRHPLADIAAKSAAPLGAAFVALALVTGSLWARPSWGTFWPWTDAQLVSQLILMFLYVGYIAMWSALDDCNRAPKAAAILVLVGAADLPIIYFSINWWIGANVAILVLRTHVPLAVFWPLWIMFLGYMALFVWLWLLRMRAEIFDRRARSLMLARGA
jgi:heme exporter protein C